MQVLLIENDINTSPFTPAVHACVPPLPWSVTKADIDDPQRCDAGAEGTANLTVALQCPEQAPVEACRKDLTLYNSLLIQEYS